MFNKFFSSIIAAAVVFSALSMAVFTYVSEQDKPAFAIQQTEQLTHIRPVYCYTIDGIGYCQIRIRGQATVQDHLRYARARAENRIGQNFAYHLQSYVPENTYWYGEAGCGNGLDTDSSSQLQKDDVVISSLVTVRICR